MVMRTPVVLRMVMLGMPMTGCSDQGPDMATPTYPQFGDVRTVGDHREIEVRFQSDGAVLTRTLFVPATGSGVQNRPATSGGRSLCDPPDGRAGARLAP